MRVLVDPAEVEFTAIRAQGAGGQNVNKVSSAVHLRYDVRASSLPAAIKQRLLESSDQRVSDDGVVVIKAQTSRSRVLNQQDALHRLQALVDAAAAVPRVRRATRPTLASKKRRVQTKIQHGALKARRGKVGALQNS